MYLKFLSMKDSIFYLDFLKKNGRSLCETYIGSDEIALKVEDALLALELIKDSQAMIIGGDVLSEDNNKIMYAHQLWGQEYHVLNWYLDSEDYKRKDFLKSYLIAKEAIINANNIANKLKKKCYIVFVIE